ncbi:MAG: hypothetical protein V4510_02800 [bacterium]
MSEPPEPVQPQPPATAPPHPAEPHTLLGDIHASTLALRKRLSSAHAFRDRGIAILAAVGLSILAVLAVLPIARPGYAEMTERLATIGALTFLIAAPGYWLGLGHRSVAIAAAIVLTLYASTAWLGGGGRVNDLFVVARVLAFLIFGLAGFNLVFVLEEMIYDAHRLLPHRRRGWLALPLILDVAVCVALPVWWRHGGLYLPTLWIGAMITSAILASWWFIRLVNRLDLRGLVIRELHLFVAGILAACALADAVSYLIALEGGLDTLLVYLVLLGTWVYVSYTTLQRTHLLLRGRNAAPWAAILLAATYAIVAFGQNLFLHDDKNAVAYLFAHRMAYLIAGIWIGIAFYAARGLWRTFRLMGRLRTITPRGRAVAATAAKVAEGVMATERVVEQATRGLYLGLDRALPGQAKAPTRPPPPRGGWVLDEDAQIKVVDDDETNE